MGIEEQLRKFKKLYDDGVLTEEEYQEKKDELIKQIELDHVKSEKKTVGDVFSADTAKSFGAVMKKAGQKFLDMSVKKLVVIVLILIIILTSLWYFFLRTKNFNELYGKKYGKEKWCKIVDDGSSMKFDTNPTDMEMPDEDDYFSYSKYEAAMAEYNSYLDDVSDAMEKVNKDLGFSESLNEEIFETTGLDGKQSDESENGRYEITYSYHPSAGLEIIYKIND